MTTTFVGRHRGARFQKTDVRPQRLGPATTSTVAVIGRCPNADTDKLPADTPTYYAAGAPWLEDVGEGDVADAIRRIQALATHPLIIINASAIPGDSAEGHETGIYTLGNSYSLTGVKPASAVVVGEDAATSRLDRRLRYSYTGSGGTRVTDKAATPNAKANVSNQALARQAMTAADRTPVVTGISVAGTAMKTIAITYSEPLSEAAVPPTTAFTVGGGGAAVAVGGVAISGSTVTVTTTTNVGTNTTIAYAVPSAKSLQIQSLAGGKSAAEITTTGSLLTREVIAPLFVDGYLDNGKIVIKSSEPLASAGVTSQWSVQTSDDGSTWVGVNLQDPPALSDDETQIILTPVNLSTLGWISRAGAAAADARVPIVVQLGATTPDGALDIKNQINHEWVKCVYNSTQETIDGETETLDGAISYASAIAQVPPWVSPSSRRVITDSVDRIAKYTPGVAESVADRLTFAGVNLIRRHHELGWITWGYRATDGTPIMETRTADWISQLIESKSTRVIDRRLLPVNARAVREMVLVELRKLERSGALYPGSDVWFHRSDNPQKSLNDGIAVWGMSFQVVLSTEDARFYYYPDSSLVTQALFGDQGEELR